MKTFQKLIPLIFISLIFLFNGCEKKEIDTSTDSAESNAQAMEQVISTYSEIQNIGIDEIGIHKLSENACYTLTIDTSANYYPVTATVDFGTTGCASADGKIRKGKVTFTMSGNWETTGTEVALTYGDDFYIGSSANSMVKTTGTLAIKNLGNKNYELTAKNVKIYTEPIVEWEANLTFDLSTPRIIKVTGTTQGSDKTGNRYSTAITSAIVKALDCRWIQSGIIEITPTGKDVRVINFGSGTCDNKANITVGSVSVDFEMN